MGLKLGIDTGGTYTDAVLFDDDRGVLATAKALTTKHDLALGVREAVTRVLAQNDEPVDLVGLSTTLATNALVEGHGGPVGLVMIGFAEDALQRAGLGTALGGDPVAFIAGGHAAAGSELCPLDEDAVLRAIEAMARRVDAFAVTGHFAVRNPAHERRVAELVRAVAGKPCTCSHELTSRLDAPRRALTTLLNARLIPFIDRLVVAVQDLLAARGIEAPLMVVKGDGSLIAAATARQRPVETILSGPAASVVGAAYLSGERDAFVADIGGTTTDVALLRDGLPDIDANGAVVGGWRTMVQAVAMHTFGLGGDSELRVDERKALVLGPRRCVPLSLLGQEHPHVLQVMAAQLEREVFRQHDGRFALRLRALDDDGASLGRSQRDLWRLLADGPLALEEIVERRHLEMPLKRLVERGLVITAGFTPSDAAHVLGLQATWSTAAALLGGRLTARFLSVAHGGEGDAGSLARQVMELAVVQTGEALVAATLAGEGGEAPDASLRQFVRRALAAPSADAILGVRLTLGRPVVAVGAPARLIYPQVAERLGTRLVIPPHAEVSNAIGAVAGEVRHETVVLVTSPDEQRYRVHLPSGPRDLLRMEEALDLAEAEARALATAAARDAGADEVAVSVARKLTIVDRVGGDRLFVEATLTARATGRPRLGRVGL